MKHYKIIATCDPYNSSKYGHYKGHEVLEYDGATPIRWCHDDGFGYGYTLNECRAILMSYANEDAMKGERVAHKYFEKEYTSDCVTYRAVEI